MTATADEALRRIAEHHWYHTIEVAPGILTPGHFDTRAATAKVPLPADLTGMRCLDVGTWDGFWAFEMEKRGAASVTAIDVLDPADWDWPPADRLGSAHAIATATLEAAKGRGEAFLTARDLLGSNVERLDSSVYELDPQQVGTFDVVFLGSLLLHLRDPVQALSRLRSVCSGQAVIADAVQAIPTLLHPHTPLARLEGIDRPWWWQPNVAALERMIASAGFDVLERTGLYAIPLGPAHARASLRYQLRALRTAAGREEIIVQHWGVPHAAVRAVPLAER